MLRAIKKLLPLVMNGIKKFIAMKLVSKNAPVHKRYVQKHYLGLSRLRQDNVTFRNTVAVEHPQLVIYGQNVEVSGGGQWDARCGIVIGEGSSIGNNVTMKTRTNRKTHIQYGPITIAPETIVPSNTVINPSAEVGKFNLDHLSKKYNQGEGLFFVVSTGRSGSKAIAHLLNQHSQVKAYHDSLAHLNVYACDKMYGRRKPLEIENSLQKIFVSLSLSDQHIHGFSDQKVSLLIPEIYSIFPKAKFVWLIRKGDSFVNAAYSRGWYFNREFDYPPNQNEFFHSDVIPSTMDAAHRMNAFKIGLLSENRWKEMTAFERNCWYWKWLNSTIEQELNKITRDQWIRVDLHNLNEEVEKVLSFLEVDVKPLKAKKVNAAVYKKVSKSSWNEQMKNIFEVHCGEAMKQWF